MSSSNLYKAMKLATDLHSDKDRTGEPSIMHPLSVMLGVEGESEKVVAMLHDTIEDTPATLEDLRLLGFAPEIVAAVEAMTHHEDESYADYLVRCKADPIARRVKQADIEHNFNLPRTLFRPTRLADDLDRLRRYVLSWQFLGDLLTEEEYRTAMERCISVDP